MNTKDLTIGKFYFVGTKRGAVLCQYNGQTANGKKFAFVGHLYMAVFPADWSVLPTVSPAQKKFFNRTLDLATWKMKNDLEQYAAGYYSGANLAFAKYAATEEDAIAALDIQFL